jgi:hypothetical protein
VLTLSVVIPPQKVYAQGLSGGGLGQLNLPAPGEMIQMSPAYKPVIVQGLTLHSENPLKFDFMIDKGDSGLNGKDFEDEVSKLIQYFMAALTVPEDEMWVNLSPYEKDRIIAAGLSETALGRDMLSQDYILKQFASSITYPETEIGGKFWDAVYEKIRSVGRTTDIPVNTFNKVWIVPDDAVVYVNGMNVFVVKSHLKVMLESDYLAMEHNSLKKDVDFTDSEKGDTADLNSVSSSIMRDVVIPEIEKEVNQGNNFAPLRQIFNSMILAVWYKKNLRQSLLGRIYVDRDKISGIGLNDKAIKEKIYNQYINAFKQGVFNFIREDYDKTTQEMIPRKYFSGGIEGNPQVSDKSMLSIEDIRRAGLSSGDKSRVTFEIRGKGGSPIVNDRLASVPNRRNFLNTLLNPLRVGLVLTLLVAMPSQSFSAEQKWTHTDAGSSLELVIAPNDNIESVIREIASQNKLLIANGITEVQMDELRMRFKNDNPSYSGRLTPGQKLDGTGIYRELRLMDILGKSEPVAIQDELIGGQKVKFYYLFAKDESLSSGAETIRVGNTQNMVFDIKSFNEDIARIRKAVLNPQNLKDEFTADFYSDWTPERIFRSLLEEAQYHELTHSLTVEAIARGDFDKNLLRNTVVKKEFDSIARFPQGKNLYRVKEELAAILAELSYSQNARSFLGSLGFVAVGGAGNVDFLNYASAADIVIELIYNELGFNRYLFQYELGKQEAEKGKPLTGAEKDELLKKSPDSYSTWQYDTIPPQRFFHYQNFPKSLTDDVIRQAAMKLFNQLFGNLPSKNLIHIPDEAIVKHRDTYYEYHEGFIRKIRRYIFGHASSPAEEVGKDTMVANENSAGEDVGGIDLNPANWRLEAHEWQQEIKLFTDYELFDETAVNEFQPVIVNISPVSTADLIHLIGNIK